MISGNEASKTLKKLKLKVDVDNQAFDSQVREVLFYDTPEFDLYNHHFILRKRTFYDQGWPRPGHERLSNTAPRTLPPRRASTCVRNWEDTTR